MGCCISKCRPDNKHYSQELDQFHHHVQDKLVVARQTPTTLYYSSNKKISPSPPSPTSSTSSISNSFTCTTTSNATISSASSFSSASSAALSSNKDRSFSNEFLWSCYKENPHITRINSLRELATLPLDIPTKPKPDQPRKKTIINPSPTTKRSPSQKVVNVGTTSFSMPQKRVRSNSPTNLTRQKSFRKEQPQPQPPPLRRPNVITSRSTLLGSPSPSSRFINGDNKCDSVSKRMINNSTKVSVTHCYSRSVSPSIRKESTVVKAASPNMLQPGLRHRETVVKDVLSGHDDVDSTMMMEDVNNPLISLDCFIFL